MPNQAEDLRSFIAMVRNTDYLILDTETTGLKRPAEIWQIAITDYMGRKLFDTRLKPAICPEYPSFNHHEITRDDLKDCPTWRDVRPSIERMIAGMDVVVYNATFDRHMFHCSDENNGYLQFDWQGHARWWCAMKAYGEFTGIWNDYFGNWKWHKLIEAAKAFGVADDQTHFALDDCRMTSQIVRKMVEELSDLDLDYIHSSTNFTWNQLFEEV